jgi:formylglycine-generating enzyme required for sulfatase activity
VTNVSSGESAAFAEWLGGSLPTEIEWECAVRGADDGGYPQPWGSAEPTRERCQIFFGDLGPVPVDKLTAGQSPLGMLNAIGNAAEWCQNSEPGGGFVLRGCSFATANIDDVRVTWRRTGDNRGEEDTGFRVVVPVEAPTSDAPATTQLELESPGSPTLLTPVVVLYSLPWDSISRELGWTE